MLNDKSFLNITIFYLGYNRFLFKTPSFLLLCWFKILLKFFLKVLIMIFHTKINSRFNCNKHLVLLTEMQINIDLSKQVIEVCFSQHLNKIHHQSFYLNGVPVKRCTSKKHLELVIDVKLNFYKCIKEEISKCNK